MNSYNLKEMERIVKDLLLFNSSWQKKALLKGFSKKTLSRLNVYKDLIKNRFHDAFCSIYPKTSLIFKNKWDKLISQYFEKYPPSSPLLNRIAKDLPAYLLTQTKILKKYPFIHELALYEWLELEIYEKTGEPGNRRSWDKNDLVLNPIHELCTFNYPIPEIVEKMENKKTLGKIQEKPTNVIIYRDPKTQQVRFFELSAPSFAYIQLLQLGFPYDAITQLLMNSYGIPEENYKEFNKQVKDFVKGLVRNRILV